MHMQQTLTKSCQTSVSVGCFPNHSFQVKVQIAETEIVSEYTSIHSAHTKSTSAYMYTCYTWYYMYVYSTSGYHTCVYIYITSIFRSHCCCFADSDCWLVFAYSRFYQEGISKVIDEAPQGEGFQPCGILSWITRYWCITNYMCNMIYSLVYIHIWYIYIYILQCMYNIIIYI